MCNLKSKVILNLEINDLELISELNRISLELNISQDKLIESAIKKLINDIEYVRQLKNYLWSRWLNIVLKTSIAICFSFGDLLKISCLNCSTILSSSAL